MVHEPPASVITKGGETAPSRQKQLYSLLYCKADNSYAGEEAENGKANVFTAFLLFTLNHKQKSSNN